MSFSYTYRYSIDYDTKFAVVGRKEGLKCISLVILMYLLVFRWQDTELCFEIL